MHLPRFALALPLLLVLPPAARAENHLNAYGYDSGGQYHGTNYGSTPNLNLRSTVDVSALQAQLQKDFALLLAPPRPAWRDDRQWQPPPRPPPPPKTAGQLRQEKFRRDAAAG
ncbi:MAG: hypothetical protein H7343_13365, partial [Undibacterium sp.]|nr:hypothetical protein [Opitutaceae bacterium]